MKLRTLYQRRLKLTRDLAALNASIQILEHSRVWAACLKVHHVNGCAVGRRAADVIFSDGVTRPDNKKRTRDWSMVDCIICWKTRKMVRSSEIAP